jgi:hypothetical protein
VNVSVKNPVKENVFAVIIRSGTLKMKYCAQIFAFFTELPMRTILAFVKKHKLTASQMLCFYEKNVKKYYRNPALEDYFKYAG